MSSARVKESESANVPIVTVGSSVPRCLDECNTLGPSGLDRNDRGGRSWGRIGPVEQRALPSEHLAQAEASNKLTTK